MDSTYLGIKIKDNRSKKHYFIPVLVSVLCVFGIFGLLFTENSHELTQYTLENEEFKAFIASFDKEYSSQDEYYLRFQIFRENSALIRLHNLQQLNFFLGINQCADLTTEEFEIFFYSPISEFSYK